MKRDKYKENNFNSFIQNFRNLNICSESGAWRDVWYAGNVNNMAYSEK